MTTPRETDPGATASSTPPLAARYLARRLARDTGLGPRPSARAHLRWLVVWWRGDDVATEAAPPALATALAAALAGVTLDRLTVDHGAHIAPMVGLLGTVTGMIFAFQQVATTRGAAGAGG